ncbi:O-antigen ligase family protein [Saccharibacillus alkalitolerans]|uniref:O-antigen ligase family protein n=1 Tax=Saccharibacillus alkalitolerans TaxID=2705290 RepID=UPI002E28AD0D|nr:O-antigen ligase family protein [Saccharibacillus alkalitolerans]
MAAFAKHLTLLNQRDITAIAVWLLPLMYAVSLISAASHSLAMNMLLIMCANAAFFVIGLFLMQHPLANKIMRVTLLWTTYLIVIFGLLNWLGQRTFSGSLVGWFTQIVTGGVYKDAVMTDSNGLRLTSVFQYANTYAAFLMAMLFVVLFTVARTNRWWDRAIHAFMLVPIILSIALTLSRGGLVMLPVAFLIVLLLLKPAQQLIWIINLLISAAAAFAVLGPLTELGLQLNQVYNGSDAFKAWGILIAASLANALLLWAVGRYVQPLLERKLEGWSSRKTSSLWLPLGGLVVAALLALLVIGTSVKNVLPENIRTRVENINFQQHSVLERITFYKDSLKVVKDYPVIGAGGGAWAVLYEKYQNNPYISNQAHNYFLQSLDETGIVGFVIFMAFLLYLFVQYLRRYFRMEAGERKDSHFFYFLIAFSILLHSILDFNMSYMYISLLVFFSLGGMAAGIVPVPFGKTKAEAAEKKKNNSLLGSSKGLAGGNSTGKSGSWLPGLYTLLAGILGVVMIVVAARYLVASNSAIKATNMLDSGVQQTYEDVRQPLDETLDIRNTYPVTAAQLAAVLQNVYSQTQDEMYIKEADELLQKALKAEPYDKNLINQMIYSYQLRGDQKAAFDLMSDSLDKYVWDASWYERVIQSAFNESYQAFNAQDTASMQYYANRGIEAYNRLLAGVEDLKNLPEGQMQGREFAASRSMQQNAGKLMYFNGQTQESADLLKSILTDDYADPANQEAALWYLVALNKLGDSDPSVLKGLTAAAPGMQEQLKQLEAVQF